jgi:hypothetical protein
VHSWYYLLVELTRNSHPFLCVSVAGANAIVSGSGVFGAADYAEAIKGIKTSKNPANQPVHA